MWYRTARQAIFERRIQLHGIDVSMPMLEYARKELPSHHFHQMDMREINLPSTFDGVIITARSISYILSNIDVIALFDLSKMY